MGERGQKTRCRRCGFVREHRVTEQDGKAVLESACVRCMGRLPRARLVWRDDDELESRAAE